MRPTWTAPEWELVVRAAGSGGIPPAGWASRVMGSGLAPTGGRGLSRVSARPVLWGQILERWQSLSWAMVVLADRAPAQGWAQVSSLVGRAGVVITGHADTVTRGETRLAGEVPRLAVTSVLAAGPGARPGARRARSVDPGCRVHRAKILLDPQVRDQLHGACQARRWGVSDFVAAVTTLSAWLALTGVGTPAAAQPLGELLHVARGAAAAALALVGGPGVVDLGQWAALADLVARASAIVDGCADGTGGDQAVVDPSGLLDAAFPGLGWASPWAVAVP